MQRGSFVYHFIYILMSNGVLFISCVKPFGEYCLHRYAYMYIQINCICAF